MPTSARAVPRSMTWLVWTAASLVVFLWLVALLSATPHILFPPGAPFVDIAVYQGRFSLLHTARFFTSRAFSGFAYPAGAAPIYAAFYATGSPVLTYLVLATIILALALAALAPALRRRSALTLFAPLVIAFSFPVLFLVQRANIELLLIVATASAILLYCRGFALASALLIGLAAAVKLYPIILIGLFLQKRKDLPAFAIGILTFAFASLAAMQWAGPSLFIAAHGFLTGVGHFQDHYVNTVSRTEILWDHTLFALVKNWAFAHHTSTAPYIHTYYTLAGMFALLLFLRVRTLPFLNRIVFLSAAMVSLPPVSFTYTLGHLLVPTVLLLFAILDHRKRLTVSLAICGIFFVFLPLACLQVFASFPSGLVQSITLLALMMLASFQAWPSGSTV